MSAIDLAAPTALEFHYQQTDSFAPLLRQLNVSLLVTTYQANKLLVVRAAGGGLSTLVRTFDRPMGLAADGRRLAVVLFSVVWLLRKSTLFAYTTLVQRGYVLLDRPRA